MAGTDKKTITRSRILNYVINNQITSKAEVSKNLNLSMPTVLSNINDLIAKGIIIETGEYESTGGRKAKSIGINPSYRYSVGIVITANHVGIVLVNLKYEIVKFRWSKECCKRLKTVFAALFLTAKKDICSFLFTGNMV